MCRGNIRARAAFPHAPSGPPARNHPNRDNSRCRRGLRRGAAPPRTSANATDPPPPCARRVPRSVPARACRPIRSHAFLMPDTQCLLHPARLRVQAAARRRRPRPHRRRARPLLQSPRQRPGHRRSRRPAPLAPLHRRQAPDHARGAQPLDDAGRRRRLAREPPVRRRHQGPPHRLHPASPSRSPPPHAAGVGPAGGNQAPAHRLAPLAPHPGPPAHHLPPSRSLPAPHRELPHPSTGVRPRHRQLAPQFTTRYSNAPCPWRPVRQCFFRHSSHLHHWQLVRQCAFRSNSPCHRRLAPQCFFRHSNCRRIFPLFI
ncbi:MAG: hypothetical protein GIKADHBN_01519 [Phycisphaerales bacterium]|nr:hypothetical protein [Phycisphaerales bacterium]